MAKCSACTSARVEELEEAIVRGESLLSVARRTGVGRMTLSRHRAHMLTRPSEREALDGRALASRRPPADPVGDLFSKIAKYEGILERRLKKAGRKGGRSSDEVRAIRELTRLAELGARASSALMPPPPGGTDVGRLIAEAARRMQEERAERWERHRAMNVRQLLEEALRLVIAEDDEDSVIAAVAAAMRAFQGDRAALAAAPVTSEVMNERVLDADILETAAMGSERLAPVVSIERAPRHTCTGQCSSFSCPEAALREHDVSRNQWF